jgi:hypothetical protein
MYMVSNLITKKRLGTIDDGKANLKAQYGYTKDRDERSSLYTELDSWATTLQQADSGRVLHGGSAPDVSDIEVIIVNHFFILVKVYGILQSVRRFPVYGDITANCNEAIGVWLQEMDKVAGKAVRQPRE